MTRDADRLRVSIVVPAYRSEATIGACLHSLVEQCRAPAFEVVVVDSSPDDRTVQVVRGFAETSARPVIRCERSAQRLFPGTARNRGAALARGEALLFLDSDCVADPDLVARALEALDAGADVVGAAIARGGDRTCSARVRHLLEFKESLPGVPARATWMLPSACVAFRRAVFERYGGFPDTRASEDWLLNWRMWQDGVRMAFAPAMRVEHQTTGGWGAVARYMRVLGRASGEARREGGLPGQLLVRHPVLAFGLPFGRTARALAWCARYDPRELRFLLLAWPAYLAMASIWAGAFFAGVRRPRPGDARRLAAKDPSE